MHGAVTQTGQRVSHSRFTRSCISSFRILFNRATRCETSLWSALPPFFQHRALISWFFSASDMRLTVPSAPHFSLRELHLWRSPLCSYTHTHTHLEEDNNTFAGLLLSLFLTAQTDTHPSALQAQTAELSELFLFTPDLHTKGRELIKS